MSKLPNGSEHELLGSVSILARRAGLVIMQIYATDFSVREKNDASPVTEADDRAEFVIRSGLTSLTPTIPIIAEESTAAGQVADIEPHGRPFWLVDPLDGTKEFISRNGEFTVNIALIEGGKPVLGVVFAPALGRLFAGSRSTGAYVEDQSGRRQIGCRAAPDSGLTVVTSRSHGDDGALRAFLAGRKVARRVAAGSSLKLCQLAMGEADLYPRLGRTMEWDIAAGHAVLVAAGGSVRRLDDGQELSYGKTGFENPHFVATGSVAITGWHAGEATAMRGRNVTAMSPTSCA
jgi:3'(2'), 5'-bisphosphate nucleotidase